MRSLMEFLHTVITTINNTYNASLISMIAVINLPPLIVVTEELPYLGTY